MQGEGSILNGKISVEKDRRYSTNETCEILGICRKTLWKYTKAGEIYAGYHKPSGIIFYLGEEIERFYNCTI